MPPFSADPSESFEDVFVRGRLQAGELSPGEFAEQVVRRRPFVDHMDQPIRREYIGPLYRRGEWSPLRRAWFFFQVAVVFGLLSTYLYVNDLVLAAALILAVVSASSLSLGLLLLVRSSAVYEIRSLSRDRNELRDQVDAYERYAELFARCVSRVAIDTPHRRHSGAPLVRDLLAHTRRNLAATGHERAALLVLRQEADRSLLTYSALPDDDLGDPPSGCRELMPADLAAWRETFAASHVVEFHIGDFRQELLALSSRPFQRCDRLALDQLAACLSLAAARNLASH